VSGERWPIGCGVNFIVREVGDYFRRAALMVGLLAMRMSASISDTRVDAKPARLVPFKLQAPTPN
jgi:hypothetical protein